MVQNEIEELKKRLDTLEALVSWQYQIIEFQLDVLKKHQWIGIDELKRYYMKPISPTPSRIEEIIIPSIIPYPKNEDQHYFQPIAYGVPPRDGFYEKD